MKKAVQFVGLGQGQQLAIQRLVGRKRRRRRRRRGLGGPGRCVWSAREGSFKS